MSHNIFRNRRDLGALPQIGNLLAPSYSRYVPRGGWVVNTGTAGSLLGTTGMTQDVSSTADDASFGFTLSFSFPFYGVNRTVYAGSNSYLTFGAGSTVYTGISCTSPGRALLIKAADNSWQRLYHIDNGNGSFRIRFEGTNATTGTPGAPTMTWEATLYNDGKIMLVNGANNRAGAVSAISNGTADATCLTYTFAENQSFVFDPSGSTYNIYTGASVVAA